MGHRGFLSEWPRFWSAVRAAINSQSPITRQYDDAVLGVVRDELGLAIPIIAGMDFGHTDPFFVLPYGVSAEIDCDAHRFSIVESAVV